MGWTVLSYWLVTIQTLKDLSQNCQNYFQLWHLPYNPLAVFFRMLIAEYQNTSKFEYRIQYNCCCEHLTFLCKRAALSSQHREKKISMKTLTKWFIQTSEMSSTTGTYSFWLAHIYYHYYLANHMFIIWNSLCCY